MRRRFFKRKHAQRWRVESVFFRHKRRLGSALTTPVNPLKAGRSLS
jgi:hypothetical protein